ncbi:MAG: DNA-3-methyladenine glycosylase 2 family protein [Anaerolineae bacterium]|nr:DNA-3-methyladenine glycosylase 2 family protein [Anaerolineae bacterium]
MQLTKVTTIQLAPTAPFNFDATFHKPDHFTTGDNYWEPGVRRQTFHWLGRTLGLTFSDAGSVDHPAIRVDIHYDSQLEEHYLESLAAEICYRYNLDLDLTGFYAAFGSDAVLGPILSRWRGMRPGHPSSLYEYLIIGIVLQNATVKRSIQMFQALLEHYGTLLSFDGHDLWCFWPPGRLASISEEDLRAIKVGYRARSIKRIDDAFASGQLDELTLRQQDRETQRRELLKLYGVGPATVWYLLMDVFHHWDFFDHISPWEQKIYSKVFFDRDPEDPAPVDDLLAHFDRYGGYKQLAVHYIWEDLWWKRKNEPVPWLEKLIRT